MGHHLHVVKLACWLEALELYMIGAYEVITNVAGLGTFAACTGFCQKGQHLKISVVLQQEVQPEGMILEISHYIQVNQDTQTFGLTDQQKIHLVKAQSNSLFL